MPPRPASSWTAAPSPNTPPNSPNSTGAASSSSELKPNDKFDEARVRLLTGGDKIKARRMRQDYFSFTPTHHLWLLGNHQPEVGTGGHAFWRRIRLIPFERVVAADRKIDNLAGELVEEEGPGILHWLIQGAMRYLTSRDP